MDEVLVKAAQYMDEHGKAVGVYRDKDGSVCMIGAIRAVVLGRVFAPEITREKHRLLKEAYERLRAFANAKEIHFNGAYLDVAFISDQVLGTKEETVKFMMEAAEWEPGT